jgi:hypothetical protein
MDHQTGDVTDVSCDELMMQPLEQVQADAQQVMMQSTNVRLSS